MSNYYPNYGGGNTPPGGYNNNDNGFLGSGDRGYGGSQQGGYYGGYPGYQGGGQQGGYSGGYPGYQGGGRQGGYSGSPNGYQSYPPPQQGSPYNPYMRSGYGYNTASYGGGSFVKRNIPIIPNNAVNYVVFLPFLALFLENFAVNMMLGILLWVLVVFFMRFAAYQDAKAAVEKNILQESAKTVAMISPAVYIFMRCRALERGTGRFVFICAAILAALFMNGFTSSFRMNPQSFVEYAKSRYLSEIGLYNDLDNFEENYVVSERADIFLDAQDWSYSEFDGKKCIILTGKFSANAPEEYKGKELELRFDSNFDGYNIKTMTLNVSECAVDEEELSNKETEELAKGIFHDWEDKGASSSSDDSSSVPDTDKKKKEKEKGVYDA